MRDDNFLDALAEVAREERDREMADLDDRWDRLAAGTLSAEEDAELRALAATSDDARMAYEAFRPLDADFKRRVVREIQDRAVTPPAPLTLGAPLAPVAPLRARAPLLRRRAGWIGLPFAAAAAALLLLVPRTPMLPSFQIAGSGGDVQGRGEESAPKERRLSPGSRLEVVVKPATAVEGRLEAEAIFVGADGEVRELGQPRETTEISPEGAARFFVHYEELPARSGGGSLRFALARLGKMPAPGDAATLRIAPGTCQGNRSWVVCRLGEPVLLSLPER